MPGLDARVRSIPEVEFCRKASAGVGEGREEERMDD
jgi:hypothetical protein